MGTYDIVFKHSDTYTDNPGLTLLNDAKNAIDKDENQKIIREKLLEAIQSFKLLLENKPHDTSSRDGLKEAWLLLGHLYQDTVEIPEINLYYQESNSHLKVFKTMLVDTLLEGDWRKQCNGKYGGPKQVDLTWKQFYIQNETKMDELTSLKDKIIWLVTCGHIEQLKMLVSTEDLRLLKNIRTIKRESLLELAVKFHHPEVVAYLLDHSAKVNEKGSHDWPPLFWAVASKDFKLVQLLVDHDAKVNMKDKSGVTALHIATKLGVLDIVELLLEKGAKLNVKDTKYHTYPINLSVYNRHSHITEYLIEKGATLNKKDPYNRSLLHWAASYGNLDLTKILVSKGLSLDDVDDIGRTPMHWASQFGHADIIRFLISQKASGLIEDKFNMTPMLIAAFAGYGNAVTAMFDDYSG